MQLVLVKKVRKNGKKGEGERWEAGGKIEVRGGRGRIGWYGWLCCEVGGGVCSGVGVGCGRVGGGVLGCWW